MRNSKSRFIGIPGGESVYLFLRIHYGSSKSEGPAKYDSLGSLSLFLCQKGNLFVEWQHVTGNMKEDRSSIWD